MKLLSLLKECYLKDLRVVDVTLGIKIIRTLDGISLSQSHYVKKMIERSKDHKIKRKYKSFSPTHPPRKNTGTGVRQLEYSQIIRSLMYLINCTRPNIAYVISKLSKYTSNPSDDYWIAFTTSIKLRITYKEICLEI